MPSACYCLSFTLKTVLPPVNTSSTLPLQSCIETTRTDFKTHIQSFSLVPNTPNLCGHSCISNFNPFPSYVNHVCGDYTLKAGECAFA